jgi:hypothetical protein
VEGLPIEHPNEYRFCAASRIHRDWPGWPTTGSSKSSGHSNTAARSGSVNAPVRVHCRKLVDSQNARLRTANFSLLWAGGTASVSAQAVSSNTTMTHLFPGWYQKTFGSRPLCFTTGFSGNSVKVNPPSLL